MFSHIVGTLTVLLILGGSFACPLLAEPAERTRLPALDDQRVLRPGDHISFGSLEKGFLPALYQVTKKGEVRIGGVRPLQAAGLTCKMLAARIREHWGVMEGEAPPKVWLAFEELTRSGPVKASFLANKTRLQSGDTLHIRLLGDRNEPGLQHVSIAGEIELPYIDGLVKVEGLTCDDLANHLKRRIEKSRFKNSTVVVTLVSRDQDLPFGPYVHFDPVLAFGKVPRQGQYDLPANGMTVSSFLKRAGGHMSPKAVPTIKIMRKTPQGNKMILVNAHAILVQKSKEHDLFLRKNDVMIVE